MKVSRGELHLPLSKDQLTDQASDYGEVGMLQVQGLITVYARPPLIFLPALPFPLLCQACCSGMH